MIALIQRVTCASVTVNRELISSIDTGLLVLVGVQLEDDASKAQRLMEKTLGYRVFPDEQGRMNMDVTQVNGELLLVPQFTLAADTSKGRRPGFSRAAAPAQAEALFSRFVDLVNVSYERVQIGSFGADMQVALVNDGPVTFWLEV